MLYIFIGCFAFLSFILFDYFSMKNYAALKYTFGVAGLLILAVSTFFIVTETMLISVSQIIQYGSLFMTIVFLVLLIYSVFIEVGSNTYEVNAKPMLVTKGTYSLVRHPGVIWFFFMYLFASLYYGSEMLFYASITWGLVNALYTYMQEKLILVKIFENYEEYIQTTPMFIPNIDSFKKFITTENWRK